MVKVSIEVRSGASRFAVSVRAASTRRAASLVRGRYPGADVRATSPMEPKGLFAQYPAARAGMVEQPAGMAA